MFINILLVFLFKYFRSNSSFVAGWSIFQVGPWEARSEMESSIQGIYEQVTLGQVTLVEGTGRKYQERAEGKVDLQRGLSGGLGWPHTEAGRRCLELGAWRLAFISHVNHGMQATSGRDSAVDPSAGSRWPCGAASWVLSAGRTPRSWENPLFTLESASGQGSAAPTPVENF